MTSNVNRRIVRQARMTHARLKLAVLVALGLNHLALFGQVVL